VRNTLDKRQRSPRSSKLVLRDVLYIPKSICNILVGSMNPFMVTLDCHGGSLSDPKSREVLYLFDKIKLWKLLLKGQPKGVTSLKPDGLYFIGSHWPKKERLR
jgi:hypothetical protein